MVLFIVSFTLNVSFSCFYTCYSSPKGHFFFSPRHSFGGLFECVFQFISQFFLILISILFVYLRHYLPLFPCYMHIHSQIIVSTVQILLYGDFNCLLVVARMYFWRAQPCYPDVSLAGLALSHISTNFIILFYIVTILLSNNCLQYTIYF